MPAAAAVLQRDWVVGRAGRAAAHRLPPLTTPEDVATAAREGGEARACPRPVTVTGENGTSGTLTPRSSPPRSPSAPDPDGGLVPELNIDVDHQGARAAARRVGDSPAATRRSTSPPAAPVVIPSQDGRGVDYPATLKDLLPVLTGTGAAARSPPSTPTQPAKLTTEKLNKLGITGVIGEFTTRGFAADSGHEHQAGRRADQRHDRAAGRDVQPQRGHQPARRRPRLRRGRHHRGRARRHAASAAASRRSPPRSTTRPTSRA